VAVTSTASPLLLIDKSAWVRADPGVLASLDGELCLCPVTRLEILHSARSFDDYEALDEGLGLLRPLACSAGVWPAAVSAQRELARRGHHRVPLPDLVIAACAEQHGADILHVDRHFDLLAEVFQFRPIRLAHGR
jgi:predicted nucleic acid-binding protein